METFLKSFGGHILPLLLIASQVAAQCPMSDPPNDGIVTCVKTSSGKVCSLGCKADFDFASSPALFYVCKNDIWSFVAFPPADLSLSWPNCEKRSTPSHFKSSGLTKYYYDGDASGASEQAAIKNSFKALLNESYGRPEFCDTNALCTDSNIEILYNSDSVHCASYDVPVGIEDGGIANSSITASSYYSTYPPWNARLNNLGELAWYSLPWDTKPWIQVDLGTTTVVGAVATQGKRFVNYAKTYKMASSVDGTSWTTYKENDQEKVFQGNTNYYSTVTNQLRLTGRYFRLLPITWNAGMALKFELYGCKTFV